MRAIALLLALVASASAQVSGGPQSHHFPSTLTYGSLNGVAVPTTEAEWRFEIDHLDMAHGQDHFQGIKERKPDFFYVKYQLMETAIAGTEERDVESHCSKLGLDPENAYLHYFDDTEAEAGGQKITVRGWKGGTAAVRKDARVRGKMWGTARFVYNWADPCTRSYMKARSVRDITQGGKAHFDGIFIDEIGAPELAESISIPKAGKGGRIAEFGNQTKEEYVRGGGYFRDLSGLFSEVAREMKRVSSGRSLFYPNTANYATDGVIQVGVAADGLLTEIFSSEEATYSGKGEARIWDMAKALADKGKVFILAQTSLDTPKFPTFTAGNYATKADRHSMYSLASYWMARQGNSTYFIQAHRWAPMSTFWIKAQEFDLGQPTGDYFVWKENETDSAGQKYRIYRRNYGKAMLLFRTRYDWDASNFKDFGAPSAAYDLGGTYRVLYPSGKLGPPITRIALHLAEGVALVSATDPPR